MEITVGELIEQLKGKPKDAVLYFGGLDFFRLKDRNQDGSMVQMEFEQTVYRDSKGNLVVQDHGAAT